MDKFISIKSLGSQLTPGQKVLKSSDYQQLVDYEGLLAKFDQREQDREEKALRALEEAIVEGRKEGLDQANRQLVEQMLAYSLRMHESLRKVEHSLVDLVAEAVRKIVSDFDNETLVRNTLRSGLDMVRGGKKLIVRVHPQMQEVVQKELMEFQKGLSHVEVFSDAALKTDECILESDVGIIHASVEEQVSALVNALHKVFPQ